MTVILVQVEAPHFCAGLEFDLASSKVLRAAPIIRWTVGKEMSDVLAYIERRGWRATTVEERS